jgi:hypothetical protein
MTQRKAPKNYVNNRDFFAALVEYKKLCKEAEEKNVDLPKVPDYIGKCIMQIATRYATKPKFSGYSYKDEMIYDAIYSAIAYGVKAFNPEKTENPFAYFTQITHNAFIGRINKEQKELYTKHKLAERMMLTDTNVSRGDSSAGKLTVDTENDYMNNFVERYETKLNKVKA